MRHSSIRGSGAGGDGQGADPDRGGGGEDSSGVTEWTEAAAQGRGILSEPPGDLYLVLEVVLPQAQTHRVHAPLSDRAA
ncbi:MAG: hypothetical protein NHB36_07985 [Nitrospira sp.]|nr:hypothetical protein [Nitrospira sp.]